MTEEQENRIQGTVKWFSNKKGYGFITPNAPAEADAESSPLEDIFVHQSTIESEGYRTLDEGWLVEYSVGYDDDGKPKAEDVTAPGRGPCTGPKRSRHRRRKPTASTSTPPGDGSHDSTPAAAAVEPQPVWHDHLSQQVKEALADKNISTATGTIDIAVGPARIKLGTRSYASMAHANAILAEGSYTCDVDGNASFEWKRAIRFTDSWNPYDQNAEEILLPDVNLSDDNVEAVGLEENMATLMGEAIMDPRSALEASNFEMRRVVLTTKKRGSRAFASSA